MAGKSASIMVKLLGDDSQLKRTLGSTETGLQKLSTKFTSAGKSMMKAGGLMTAGITLPMVAALKVGMDNAVFSEKANTQLQAALKSTSAEAWISKEAMDERALAQQHMLGIDDDVIKSNQAVLLTFTNIKNEMGEGNDIFYQASDAALNLSTALGTDLQSATTMVGKALNDPVQGINAMTRAGIQFTDAQKDTIKTMVESGDTMGAQKIILGELETQFGGSAAAAADTFAGRMAIMKERFGDILQQLAESLMPHLEKLGDLLVKGMKWWDGLGESGQKVVGIMALVAAAIGPVVTVLGAVFVAIGAILSPVGLVVAAIVALIAAFVYFYKTNEGFREFVDGIVATIRQTLATAFTFITETVIPALVEAFRWFSEDVLPQVRDAVQPVLEALGEFFAAAFEKIGTVVSFVAELISTQVKIIAAIFKWLRPVISTVFNGIVAVVKAALTIITGVIKFVTGLISGDWSKAWEGIKQVFAGIWDAIKAVVTTTLRAVSQVISQAWDGVKGIFSRAWDSIKSTVGGGILTVLSFFTGLPGKLSRAARGAFDGFKNAFKSAMNWIIDKWNGLSFTLPTVSFMGKSVGGNTISTPNIPRFHSGGVFNPGMGAREGLAILEKGETVRTQEQESRLRTPQAAQEIHVHFHGPVAKDAERWIVDTVESAAAKGYQLPKLKKAVNV